MMKVAFQAESEPTHCPSGISVHQHRALLDDSVSGDAFDHFLRIRTDFAEFSQFATAQS